MVRRTVTLPEHVDRLVREHAREGESFSAAVARLLEDGLREAERPRLPYIGSGEGPPDLSTRAEEYLDELFSDPDFRH